MAADVLLTADDIARLAGVARGTVSGWRRRYADFPAPASGSGRGLVFSGAEVEAWLAGAGRLELSPNARLWREVNHAARGASLGEVVAAIAPHAASTRDLPASLVWVAERAAEEAGAVAVLGDLIDRYSAASGYYVVPARIAEFMASLAAIGEGTTVLDPASGTGELLAAALAQGAGRVLGQDANEEAAALARIRLLSGESQRAEVAVGEPLGSDAFADAFVDAFADAFVGVEADAVLCRPPLVASGSEIDLVWARHALAYLKPGGLAILLLPGSAATSPAGSRTRADLLREGSLRAVIELPLSTGWPYDVPPQLWLLRRPDADADPDLRALFVGPRPDRRPGPDEAVSPATVEAMSTAQWLAFIKTAESAWLRMNDPESRTISGGGGRNADHCVTWVADLLDDSMLDEPERLGETFAITPARVRAHFSAVCRVRDAENIEARRRDGIPEPRNPARSFTHARISLSTIPAQVDGITETLSHFGWLDAPDARSPEAGRRPAVWPPKAAQPADPWRTVTVAELARLGMLRYRRAGNVHGELLRAGDVQVPVTLAENSMATVVDTKQTVVGQQQAGDLAAPGAHLIRPNPAHLDPWFLAGFLTASAAQQQADVCQLEVPLLPLEDQERYAVAFRRLRYLKTAAASVTNSISGLTSHLTTGLTAGEIRLDAQTGS
jgi:SAM-dependent methyltransferase